MLTAKIAAKKRQTMLNLSDLNNKQQNSDYLDTNLSNLPPIEAPKRRHSVKPAADLMINDSQSNISGGDSSTKSGKLGMLFQNINRKIRQKIDHSNSMKQVGEAKSSSTTTDAVAVMPPPLQDYVKK